MDIAWNFLAALSSWTSTFFGAQALSSWTTPSYAMESITYTLLRDESNRWNGSWESPHDLQVRANLLLPFAANLPIHIKNMSLVLSRPPKLETPSNNTLHSTLATPLLDPSPPPLVLATLSALLRMYHLRILLQLQLPLPTPSPKVALILLSLIQLLLLAHLVFTNWILVLLLLLTTLPNQLWMTLPTLLSCLLMTPHQTTLLYLTLIVLQCPCLP